MLRQMLVMFLLAFACLGFTGGTAVAQGTAKGDVTSYTVNASGLVTGFTVKKTGGGSVDITIAEPNQNLTEQVIDAARNYKHRTVSVEYGAGNVFVSMTVQIDP